MSEALELEAEIRQEFGTGPARELRRKGKVPAIIYGKGKDALAISIEEKEITKHYRKSYFTLDILYKECGLDMMGKPSEDEMKSRKTIEDQSILHDLDTNPFV